MQDFENFRKTRNVKKICRLQHEKLPKIDHDGLQADHTQKWAFWNLQIAVIVSDIIICFPVLIIGLFEFYRMWWYFSLFYHCGVVLVRFPDFTKFEKSGVGKNAQIPLLDTLCKGLLQIHFGFYTINLYHWCTFAFLRWHSVI